MKNINRKKLQLNEFMKLVVIFILVNSTIWVYLSYALAFMGKEQIAEELSQNIVNTILGTILIYGIKALFENIFKNKSSSTTVKEITDDINNKTTEILSKVIDTSEES